MPYTETPNAADSAASDGPLLGILGACVRLTGAARIVHEGSDMTELDVGPMMPLPLRSAAAEPVSAWSVAAREVVIRQGGYVVDPATAPEPIRVGGS